MELPVMSYQTSGSSVPSRTALAIRTTFSSPYLAASHIKNESSTAYPAINFFVAPCNITANASVRSILCVALSVICVRFVSPAFQVFCCAGIFCPPAKISPRSTATTVTTSAFLFPLHFLGIHFLRCHSKFSYITTYKFSRKPVSLRLLPQREAGPRSRIVPLRSDPDSL